MWILGTKLRSSMRAANALSPEPSLQVPNPHQIVFLLQEDPWGSPASPPNLIGVPGQSVRDHYQKAPGQQYPEE